MAHALHLGWPGDAAVALGHATPAPAQQLTTGTITGIVQDDQGLRMPGVTVEIKNEQTNDVRTTVSNEVGLFTMPALPLGRYSLKLVVEGFATVERLGIQLRSGEVYNAGTITLSVGALTQIDHRLCRERRRPDRQRREELDPGSAGH